MFLWTSKDLTTVVIFAVLGLVYTLFVAQIAPLTGIRGAGYLFIVGHVIFISAQLLLYYGGRWRFLFSTILFVLLTLPTYFIGPPYDILARVPLVVTAIFGDMLFNSIYGFFKTHNKLLLLSIMFSLIFHPINQIFTILYYLLYAPQALSGFLSLMSFMLPIIIIESIVGGHLGYKIFERVKVFHSAVNPS
ncbi:MAG: hypothetical protein JSW14_01360 [Candidatus Bathyarchaeum sp.]|nr:MAG: hypothetical protein JSW14_01360 [Candidatus Bathyarchaeum sp.]